MSDSTPSPYSRHPEVPSILSRTRATLRRTELAFDNFPDVPDRERQVAAMHNVVVTGRAVTNVLQNLRSKAEDFDEWYGPWQEEMRRDPLLRYLYELRTRILKKGVEGVSHTTAVSLVFPRDIPPAPPNAVGFFIGDRNSGSGWDVRLEDGTIQRIYISLPEEKVRSWFSFEDYPGEHLGSTIADDSLENVCQLYVQYLRRLVEAAERHFS